MVRGLFYRVVFFLVSLIKHVWMVIGGRALSHSSIYGCRIMKEADTSTLSSVTLCFSPFHPVSSENMSFSAVLHPSNGKGLASTVPTAVRGERSSRSERLHEFKWSCRPENFVTVGELKASPLWGPLGTHRTVGFEHDSGGGSYCPRSCSSAHAPR